MKLAESPGAGGQPGLTSPDDRPVRGRVYRARLSHIEADKYFLVVSSTRRNRAFGQVLTVRLTTAKPRDSRPAMVELGPGEVMTGWVSCDDIETVHDDERRQRRHGDAMSIASIYRGAG